MFILDRQTTVTVGERLIFDLAAGLVLLAAVIIGGAVLTHKGERPFSDERRAQLMADHPLGVFDDPKTFRWCEYGWWTLTNVRGDVYRSGGNCYVYER